VTATRAGENLQSLQFLDDVGNSVDVCGESGVVLDVEQDLLVMQILSVWSVVGGERKVEELARTPCVGELAEGEFNDNQTRCSQPVLDGSVQVVHDDVHALWMDSRSVGFEESLY